MTNLNATDQAFVDGMQHAALLDRVERDDLIDEGYEGGLVAGVLLGFAVSVVPWLCAAGRRGGDIAGVRSSEEGAALLRVPMPW